MRILNVPRAKIDALIDGWRGSTTWSGTPDEWAQRRVEQYDRRMARAILTAFQPCVPGRGSAADRYPERPCRRARVDRTIELSVVRVRGDRRDGRADVDRVADDRRDLAA